MSSEIPKPTPDLFKGRKLASELVSDVQPEQLRPVLGQLQSGETVIDRPESHHHMEADLLAEALSRLDSTGQDFLAEVVHFENQIGTTICVETTDADEIVFAQRPGRKGPTRFVKHRSPEPTNEVTIVLKRTGADEMILITAFTGPKAGPESWDPNATEESRAFWESHALIWDEDNIE